MRISLAVVLSLAVLLSIFLPAIESAVVRRRGKLLAIVRKRKLAAVCQKEVNWQPFVRKREVSC